jgi:hypothetical protein
LISLQPQQVHHFGHLRDPPGQPKAAGVHHLQQPRGHRHVLRQNFRDGLRRAVGRLQPGHNLKVERRHRRQRFDARRQREKHFVRDEAVQQHHALDRAHDDFKRDGFREKLMGAAQDTQRRFVLRGIRHQYPRYLRMVLGRPVQELHSRVVRTPVHHDRVKRILLDQSNRFVEISGDNLFPTLFRPAQFRLYNLPLDGGNGE